jgi:hypothetical protein
MHERDAERALLLAGRQRGEPRLSPRLDLNEGTHAAGSCRGFGGVPQLLPFSPQERGIKGVENELPRQPETLFLDSRFRGNDKESVRLERTSGGHPRFGNVHASRASFASSLPPTRACRGAEPLVGLCNLQIRNPKRVQGLVPAEGLGVSPNYSHSPPKSGGSRGLKQGCRIAPYQQTPAFDSRRMD